LAAVAFVSGWCNKLLEAHKLFKNQNTGLWTSLKGLSGRLRSALEWCYWKGLGQVTNRHNVYFLKPTSVQSHAGDCMLSFEIVHMTVGTALRQICKNTGAPANRR
jgi:hypothetical protein